MGGGETDWVGKELTSQFFPPGKELTSQFFPREKTGRPILSPGKKLTGEKTDRHACDRHAGKIAGAILPDAAK